MSLLNRTAPRDAFHGIGRSTWRGRSQEYASVSCPAPAPSGAATINLILSLLMLDGFALLYSQILSQAELDDNVDHQLIVAAVEHGLVLPSGLSTLGLA